MSTAYSNNTYQSPIELVLSRVKHKKSSNGYMANCPAHDDKNPSLGIKEESDGKVTLNCLAGCKKENVLEAMGLEMKDLFPQNQKQESQKSKNTKVKPTLASFAEQKCLPIEFLKNVGVREIPQGLAFLYLDQESKPARAKIRTGSAHDGYWDNAYSDRAIVPYGLPVFLNLARQSGVGHIVEGESDTITGLLHKMGILGIPGARMTGKLVSSYLEGINTLCLHQEPDEAGASFIRDLEKRLKFFNYQGQVFVIKYPGNGIKDLNDLHCYCYKNNLDFKTEFQKYLDSAILLDLASEGFEPEHSNPEQHEDEKEYLEDEDDKDENPNANYSQSKNGVKNSNGYYIRVGDYVRASDRDNVGEVKAVNGQSASVYFYNKETKASAIVDKHIDELTPTNLSNSQNINTSNKNPIKWPTPLGEAAYHGIIGQVIKTIEPHTEADVAALLIQLLIALGNLMGRKPYFFVEATKHFPVLFGLVVGGTSSGKGSSLAQIKRLLTPIDEDWRKKIGPGLSSGEGLLYEVRDPRSEQKKNKETGEMEEIEVDKGVEDKRVFVTQTEFASVFKVANREGNTLFDVLRQLFDCEEFLKVRTKNAPINATGAHISIIGQITPAELSKLMTETDAFNGFLNRFLWASVKRSKFLPKGGELKEESLIPLRARIKQAVDKIQSEKEFALDDQAFALWCEKYISLAAERPDFIGAILSRSRPLIMRIALIYAVMDGANAIGRNHLEAALEVWRYCVESVECIFSNRVGDAIAEKILTELRKQQEMSRNDITALFCNNAKKEEIDNARDTLAKSGLIEIEKRKIGKAKKPTEFWVLAGINSPTDPPNKTKINIVTANDINNDINNFDHKQEEKYRSYENQNNNIVNNIVLKSFSENLVTTNQMNELNNNIVNIVNIVEGGSEQSSSLPNEIVENEDNKLSSYDINDINDINLGVKETPINLSNITEGKTVNEINPMGAIEAESLAIKNSTLVDATKGMPNFSSISTSSMYAIATLQKSLTAIQAAMNNPRFKAHKMYLRCNKILKEVNESNGMIDSLLATDVMRVVNQINDLT